MAEFVVRAAQQRDTRAMAELYAAVAEERDAIAGEPPVDVTALAGRFADDAPVSVVAVANGQIIGMLTIKVSRHGFGDIGMMVDRGSRARGVGSALLRAAVEWARGQGLHKLCLEVFPHNAAAIALYHKCGFTEEGRRIQQYRRANGQFWDSIMMGRLL